MAVVESPPEIFDDFTPTVRLQKIYVGKHGDDSSPGAIPDQPKLTIQSAITQAGTPGSESAAVVVEVMDDGEYDEDLVCTEFVNIHAPAATIKGSHTLDQNMSFLGRRFINDGDVNIFNKTASGRTFVYFDEIYSNAGSANPIAPAAGTLHLKGRRIESTTVHAIVQSGSTGDIFVEVDQIVSTGQAAFLVTGSSGIRGRVSEISGSQGIFAPVGSGEINLIVGKLACTTAYNMASGTKLRLVVTDISGTETAADGANVRVTRATRDMISPNADPTPNDDETDGYSVGSQWFRTDRKEVWICLDASAAAAVWRELGTGGGSVKVDTVDPTVADDQTEGYDPGDLWLNTADADVFVCVSAATGAAVWKVVPTGGKARLQTTDATSTKIVGITLADPETLVVDVFITARRTDAGADHAAYQRKVVVYRNGGGAVLMVPVDSPLTREVDTTWGVSLSVSGNDLEIYVTGAAGKTVEWRARYVTERM
jgi:hypothetical protein